MYIFTNNFYFDITCTVLACVADEQNPGYIRLQIRAQKLVPAPCVLPGISIITFDWLLNRAVLSCAVIGRMDLVTP